MKKYNCMRGNNNEVTRCRDFCHISPLSCIAHSRIASKLSSLHLFIAIIGFSTSYQPSERTLNFSSYYSPFFIQRITQSTHKIKKQFVRLFGNRERERERESFKIPTTSCLANRTAVYQRIHSYIYRLVYQCEYNQVRNDIYDKMLLQQHQKLICQIDCIFYRQSLRCSI